jgi:ubiquinone/menaquinone biosynthesis C-methylase UbiE
MIRRTRQRHWLKLGIHAFDLYVNRKKHPGSFVQNGYNEAASFYDTHWTNYMSKLSETMLSRLQPLKRGDGLDLTCGTGYVTFKLYEITGGNVTGVDASQGMITVAQKKYGDTCHFILHDALDFLKHQPSNSYDSITCAWGLGYVSPQIFKEISRVLRSNGKIGIIDNSMISNWEFVWCFLVALAEEPYALTSLFTPHFLLTRGALVRRMRLHGLKTIDSWKGEKIIRVENKETAMEQFIKSGVAAGMLHIIDKKQKDKLINRIGELLQDYHSPHQGLPITHRYIAAIGEKE